MRKSITIFLIFISITAHAQMFLFGGGQNATQSPTPTGGKHVAQTGGSDSNGCTFAAPCLTIQHAQDVSSSGDTIFIHAGTYRETITVSTNNLIFINYPGDRPVISGLNDVGSTGWTVHTGNIYKKTITLPAANNYNEYIGGTGYNGQDNTSNTQLLANQIFKDGNMQMHARYPKMYSVEDQMNRANYRKISQTSNFGDNSVTDAGLAQFSVSNWTGAIIGIQAWFMNQTRYITSGSGSTVNFTNTVTGVPSSKFKKMYYITNHLSLLTTAREWHYQSGVLYYWQQGGGSPIGVEYKARNWGFNIKGINGTNIKGLTFIGCDPVHGNTSTINSVVDNIRGTYMNHAFIAMNQGPGGNTRNAAQSGMKLIGSGNVLKNSEFKYASSMGVWLGQGGRAENNKFEYIDYDGSWGAPFRVWEDTDNQVITKNTTRWTGRGAVEFSGDVTRNNTNVEISYNDFSKHNAQSIDGGAIYTQLWSNHDGMVIKYNLFHDAALYNDGTGDQEGIQVTGTYFDQGAGAGPTGTVYIHHNISWNGPEADHYTQTQFEPNPSHPDGGHKVYANNTNAGHGNGQFGNSNASWVTYDHSNFPAQQRNNINRASVINQNNASDNLFSIGPGNDPQFVGGDPNVIGHLAFQLKASSPARGFATYIPGINDEDTPPYDAGALPYGQTPWSAGYILVTIP